MNLISVLLLLAAGALIGYLLTLLTVKKVWPDLYAEMLNRSLKDGDPDA